MVKEACREAAERAATAEDIETVLRFDRNGAEGLEVDAVMRALAPKMAAELQRLRAAVAAVSRMWDADEIGGEPLANLFAAAGPESSGLVLFPRNELQALLLAANVTRKIR